MVMESKLIDICFFNQISMQIFSVGRIWQLVCAPKKGSKNK